MQPIIHLHNVSKIYPVRIQAQSIRQRGIRWMLAGIQSGFSTDKPISDGFTALQNINLTIHRGESVGIVGRNGSGKTTLLRLLANIMRPTTGTVEVDGRFVALLGLGAGFINDMTGHQNIYINAAFYGLNRAQTDAIMNDVIAFAELGGFIDQPLRTYSTGMRARLGFSVAVHILPDIVFIDEALVVGDAAFRNKCYQRIHSLLQDNRTVVIVSHSNDLRELCQRGIWLNEGQIQMDGEINAVMDAYHAHNH